MFQNSEIDADKISELEQQLKDKASENTELVSEIEKLRGEVEIKDKSIRELTIRLEARSKNAKPGKDYDQYKFMDGRVSNLEMSFATSEDMLMFHNNGRETKGNTSTNNLAAV